MRAPHEAIRERAEEYLEAARSTAEGGLWNATFELARTAAELACKALLERAVSAFPKTHDPSAELHRQGLVPRGVLPVRLRALLGAYSRGAYGTGAPVTRHEAREAIRLADRLIEALNAANP